MHHQPLPRLVPLVSACNKLKEFIDEQLQLGHPRDDCREFLHLAASVIGIKRSAVLLLKPGGLHRARWMAKAIYAMKIELLLEDNEIVIQLTARELQSITLINRVLVTIYIQSWFSCWIVAYAPLNDIMLIQRLHDYDDAALQSVGLKMMERHLWYISPELATSAQFSHHLSDEDKTQLVFHEHERWSRTTSDTQDSSSNSIWVTDFTKILPNDEHWQQFPVYSNSRVAW